MANCDEIFQKIQELQRQRDALTEQINQQTEMLDPKDRVDPARVFIARDKQTGLDVEVSFDEMFDAVRRADSPMMQEWAARAAGERITPVGSDGQFQNLRQMVDRMGVEDAQQMAAMVQAITGRWEELNPRDWNAVTQINDRKIFVQRLADAFAESGVRLDKDSISQGVAENVAPFLTILNRQTKLQVFADVTRQTLLERMAEVRKAVAAAGEASPEVKYAFMDAAAKAIFAQRSAALSRRVSGQLLQQLQNDVSTPPAIAARLFNEELIKEADKIFLTNGKDLISEDSLVGQFVEAVNRGADGIADMEQLELTVKVDGADPTVSLDQDWARNWRRQARAYYKDSQLFNLNTQFINNYLANKLVFVAEGYRKAFENGVRLHPVGTGFFRKVFSVDKTFQGARIAAEAGLMAHDAIKQGWGDSMRLGFMESKTPFSGNPDQLGMQGALPIDQQYEIAYRVLWGDEGRNALPDDAGIGQMAWGALTHAFDEAKADPKMFPIHVRDKVFVSTKLFGNYLIEKAGGPRLPVTSALQMLAAVDQRAGLRTFMTARANELLLDSYNTKPDLSWPERRALVKKQLDDQLYQATPTEQNIKDFRDQYGFTADELSDDEVATVIANEHLGKPVLVTPEQLEALGLSQYARMQQKPKGTLGKMDQGIMAARENAYVDALFPYWRSPMSQMIWDMKLARPPIIETAKIVFGKKNISVKEEAEVLAGWHVWLSMVGMWGTLEAAGVIEGNGPIDPKARQQWLAAGHKPNSVFGIPYNMGGLPILNTLFLYSDLHNNFTSGEYSDYDRYKAFMSLGQVAVGQLMRQTGWKQFQMLGDTLMSTSQKQWERFFGFLANGQMNPASGPIRQVERIAGLTSQDMYPPRYETPGDRYAGDQIGDDDPLKEIERNLRNWAYNMVPSVAYLMGQPLKERDYLGTEVKRPEGIFKGELPVGVPGMWDNPVYAELERLQMLQPPAPLMTGRLGTGGVLMGPELEREFNEHLGSSKGGPISDHPNFGGRLGVTFKAVEGEFDRGDQRRYESTYSQKIDLAPLLDRLTDGKTLREALNGLFASDTYRSWEADPRFTTNAAVKDKPREVITQMPGPRAVKILHDYYATLAEEKVETSESAAAADWRQRRNAKIGLTTPALVDESADALERTLMR